MLFGRCLFFYARRSSNRRYCELPLASTDKLFYGLKGQASLSRCATSLRQAIGGQAVQRRNDQQVQSGQAAAALTHTSAHKEVRHEPI